MAAEAFYKTDDLRGEEVFLRLTKTCDAQPKKKWVPAYYFDICLWMGRESDIAICASAIMKKPPSAGTSDMG